MLARAGTQPDVAKQILEATEPAALMIVSCQAGCQLRMADGWCRSVGVAVPEGT